MSLLRSRILLLLISCNLLSGLTAAEATPVESPYSWTGSATNSTGRVIARVLVDSRETPDLANWGRHAGELSALWYGRIADLLPSDGFKPYGEVTLIFRADMEGVAATGGNNIFIAAKFVRNNTNDFGMVIHELTHVVQAYPSGGPGWLVEGIADYIRLAHFEPHATRPQLDPSQAKYTDAYKTTAIFLEWLQQHGNPGLVKQLNAALRQQRYKDEIFRELTHKDIGTLWTEFVKALPPQ